MTTRFTALVLAGSRAGSDPVAAYAGTRFKCLAPVAGVPMLERVVLTLLATPAIGRILISLPEPDLLDQLPALARWRAEGRVRALPTAQTPSLSVQAALDAVPDGFPWLVTTADHPLLTPEMLEALIAGADGQGADVAAGLTASAVLLRAYPDSVRTFIRFRDERYSGANLFLLLTPEARRAVAFWRRIEQERKRPWRMVRAFGIGSLLLYGLGLLTLEQAMARASRVIGAKAVAVPLPFAEACIDVDKPADLALADTILARRAAG